MAIMLHVDKTEKSLEKRAFLIDVFLAFSKVLALLIMIFYCWTWNIVVFEALHWNSVRFIEMKGFLYAAYNGKR